MDARKYWEAYVERHQGASGVATHLEIPYSTIAGICNGSRGIGRRLAERMASKDASLDPKVLVWVQPQRKRDSQSTSS